MGFHRATIYRKIKWFRIAFGAHPDEFDMPGVKLDDQLAELLDRIDVGRLWDAASESERRKLLERFWRASPFFPTAWSSSPRSAGAQRGLCRGRAKGLGEK